MSILLVNKELSIDSHNFRLLLKNEIPLVEYENQIYSNLWTLTQQCPLFSDSLHLDFFAEVSNFFWKGLKFQVIACISTFQKEYVEQIEQEKKYPDNLYPYRLTDYKIFDVSIMHKPLLQEQYLTYFVSNISNGIPYRVVCPYPYISTNMLVHYQILPLKED